MFQGDCKLQAAGLDRVQWAFVELMVVDLEEDRVRPMEASAKHSLPVVFPCSPAALLSRNLLLRSGTGRPTVAHQQRRARGADGQGPGVRAGTAGGVWVHDDMTGGSKGSKAHAHTCLGCFNLREAADGRRRQQASSRTSVYYVSSSSTNAAACLLHHLQPLNLKGSDS